MLSAIKFTDLGKAKRFMRTSRYSGECAIIQHQHTGTFQICEQGVAQAFEKVGLARIVVQGSVRI